MYEPHIRCNLGLEFGERGKLLFFAEEREERD